MPSAGEGESMNTSASSSLAPALALGLLFTVVGCAAPAASSKAAPPAPAPSGTGTIVPLGDLENLATRLEALEGQVVLIDFWATWCPPCRVSLPYYDRWQQELGKEGLTVMAISVDAPEVDLRSFVDRFAPNLLIVRDPEGQAAGAFAVRGMPTAFLLDRQGTVVEAFTGFSEAHAASMRARIVTLIEAG